VFWKREAITTEPTPPGTGVKTETVARAFVTHFMEIEEI
jgi:hypothetical protein